MASLVRLIYPTILFVSVIRHCWDTNQFSDWIWFEWLQMLLPARNIFWGNWCEKILLRICKLFALESLYMWLNDKDNYNDTHMIIINKKTVIFVSFGQDIIQLLKCRGKEAFFSTWEAQKGRGCKNCKHFNLVFLFFGCCFCNFCISYL